ncbi:MAG: hypothetical protein ACKVU1_17895 [bacterium]
MIRKIISLLLIITITSLFIGAGTHSAFSAPPTGGDVDPTGLDLRGHAIVENPKESRASKLSGMERYAAEISALRWIESFLLKDFLRRISF